jgi:hypothetical protein
MTFDSSNAVAEEMLKRGSLNFFNDTILKVVRPQLNVTSPERREVSVLQTSKRKSSDFSNELQSVVESLKFEAATRNFVSSSCSSGG